MASREADATASDGAQMLVLVVDDEPDVASVTQTYLERNLASSRVEVATDGEEAMATIEGHVDCVVSDYEMPDVDGLELLNRVRDCDPDLPFILFTARGSEEIASEAISAGVTDYLQKGVGTDQYAVLANRIENVVARRRSAAEVAETRTRYRNLVESSPNAIIVHDGDAILYANERAVDLVGAGDPDTLSDVSPAAFVHEDDRALVRERMATTLEEREMADWTSFRLLGLDGDVRHVEGRGAPVSYEGSIASQVVLRDVTEQRRRSTRLEALHEATRDLLRTETPGDVATIALETIESTLAEPIAAIWEYDPTTSELVPLDTTSRAMEVVQAAGLDGPVALAEWTVEMSVFRTGEPRVVEGYGDRDDAVAEEFETVYMFPLNGHGLMNVATLEQREFGDDELDLFGILGRSVSAAFDRVLGEG